MFRPAASHPSSRFRIQPTGEPSQVRNDPDGVGDLVNRMQEPEPERIVLEATGELGVRP